MSIIGTARALMAVMQPLTGTRATGTITLTAKAGTSFELKAGHYAFPVVDGKIRPYLLIKVAAPASGDSWTITDAGIAVPFISNLGGERYNFDVGTDVKMDPPIADLDTAEVTTAFTNGVNASGFGAVKDMVVAETLEGPVLPIDIRRNPGIRRFPAVVVTWDDGIPSDGSTQVTKGRGSRVGTRKQIFSYTYQITVISSRADSDHERRHEGLYIAEQIASLITDRHSVDDGECLSNPGPVQIRSIFRENGPQDVFQKFYVYHVVASCDGTLQTIDSRTFPTWLRTVMNVDVPQDPALPNQGDYRIVTDNEIDMG